MPKTHGAASAPGVPPASAAPPAPEAPPQVPQSVHVGQVVRCLREASGLTRLDLQRQTGVSVGAICHLETGRHRPTAWTLRKLLRAVCMRGLPELAAQAGLELNVGAELGVGQMVGEHL